MPDETGWPWVLDEEPEPEEPVQHIVDAELIIPTVWHTLSDREMERYAAEVKRIMGVTPACLTVDGKPFYPSNREIIQACRQEPETLKRSFCYKCFTIHTEAEFCAPPRKSDNASAPVER